MNKQTFGQTAPGQSAGEQDAFLFRCLKALEVARIAQQAIEAEEAHVLIRLKEEELAVEILQAEVEDVRSRWKTAFYQVVDIQKTLISYGIAPPIAPLAPAFTTEEVFNSNLTNALNRESPPLPPSPTFPGPPSPIKGLRSRSSHSPPPSSPVHASSSGAQLPSSSPTPSNTQSFEPRDLAPSQKVPLTKESSKATP